jgi:hypothetical protein
MAIDGLTNDLIIVQAPRNNSLETKPTTITEYNIEDKIAMINHS